MNKETAVQTLEKRLSILEGRLDTGYYVSDGQRNYTKTEISALKLAVNALENTKEIINEDEMMDYSEALIDKTELENLPRVLAEYILPRLKKSKELCNGFPLRDGMTFEKWLGIIDEMIWAFEYHKNFSYFNETFKKQPEEEMLAENERANNGLKLFAEYYWALGT
jgi:hypothetical protein